MPCTPTTLAALRVALDARIHAITPDYGGQDDAYEWRRVKAQAEVVGTNRGYYISIAEQAPYDEGLFATGVATYQAQMRIWTGYNEMNDERYEDCKSRDAVQLWVALTNIPGGITGLYNVIRRPWEDGTDPESTEGKRWGAHVFTLIYLLEQP